MIPINTPNILLQTVIQNGLYTDFSSQLELMFNNFGVTFMAENCCVGRRDLPQDGVHFIRRGVSRLGSLLMDIVSAPLCGLEEQPHGQDGVPAASLEFALGNSDSDHQNNCMLSAAEMCSKVIVLMSSWNHGRLAFIFTLPLTFFIYEST